jgi:hypothetical protein
VKDTPDGQQIHSRPYPVKSFAICKNDRPWAWCLDKPCIIDKNNPEAAACTCDVVKNLGAYVIVTSNYAPTTCTTVPPQLGDRTLPAFFLAVISPEHYERFKKILSQDLPDTYDAWSYRHSERVANRTVKGHAIYEVIVNPEEFSRYCHVTNSVHNLQSIERFASEKASGKRY